jgi:hypothetical protein
MNTSYACNSERRVCRPLARGLTKSWTSQCQVALIRRLTRNFWWRFASTRFNATHGLQIFSSGERNRDSLGDYAITHGGRHLSWNRIQCCSSGHAGRCGGQVGPDISGARSVWQRANHFVSNGAQRSGAGFLSFGGLVTLLQAATGPVAECARKVPAAGPRAGGTQLRL